MVLAMTFACCCGLCGTLAQGAKDPNVPAFSAEDQVIIKRNAALGALMDRDPWLVRRALDILANAPAISGRSGEVPADGFGTKEAVVKQGGNKQGTNKQGKRKSTETVPDPKHNPDLDEFSRASPEAAHDLFQLIKLAKPVNPPPKR